MKSIARKFSFFLVGVLFLTIWDLPWNSYLYRGFAQLQSMAQSEHMQVEAEHLSYDFPTGLRAENLVFAANLGQFTIPVSIDEPNISLSVFPLAWLSLELKADGKLCDGQFNVAFYKSILNDKLSGEVAATEVDLSTYQPGMPLALEAIANLEGEIAIESTAPLLVKSSRLLITLQNGAYNGDYRVAGLFAIPKVKDLELDVELRVENNDIWFENATLYSSLGRAALRGKAKLNGAGMIRDVQSRIEITLTADGRKSLGGYLALAANINPKDAPASWVVTASGDDLHRLRTKVSPRS